MAERAIIPAVGRPDEASDHAVAYDARFRAEVEAGIRQADDPNCEWSTNKEVERQDAERQAEWQAEIERRRKSD